MTRHRERELGRRRAEEEEFDDYKVVWGREGRSGLTRGSAKGKIIDLLCRAVRLALGGGLTPTALVAAKALI